MDKLNMAGRLCMVKAVNTDAERADAAATSDLIMMRAA